MSVRYSVMAGVVNGDVVEQLSGFAMPGDQLSFNRYDGERVEGTIVSLNDDTSLGMKWGGMTGPTYWGVIACKHNSWSKG